MTKGVIGLSAVAGARAFLALTGYAVAGIPALPNDGTQLVIPVIDEETAIEELERPNEVPPGSQEGPGPGNAPAEHGDGDAGDEVRELQRAFPSTEWPPSMKNEEE